MVRYAPDHEPFAEWVYNDADIDSRKIVWAREMDAQNDQQLIDHFKDRQVWLLEADEKPPKVESFMPARDGETKREAPKAQGGNPDGYHQWTVTPQKDPTTVKENSGRLSWFSDCFRFRW